MRDCETLRDDFNFENKLSEPMYYRSIDEQLGICFCLRSAMILLPALEEGMYRFEKKDKSNQISTPPTFSPQRRWRDYLMKFNNLDYGKLVDDVNEQYSSADDVISLRETLGLIRTHLVIDGRRSCRMVLYITIQDSTLKTE